MNNHTECKVCLLTSDIARMDDNGICEYCNLNHDLAAKADPKKWESDVARMKSDGRRFDCLIGVSGGYDSSVLAMLAKDYGLNALLFHFDNGFNEDFATKNLLAVAAHTGFSVYIKRYGKQEQLEYNKMCRAMLLSGTPDGDVVNDMVMAQMMLEVARRYRIKCILNGHDFRTEGSTPRPWTRLDSNYIVDICERVGGFTPEHVKLLTVKDQLLQYMWGIRQVRPLHHVQLPRHLFLKRLAEIGWQNYDLKHAENSYTRMVGYDLLPEKFGIDKRRVYYSALIRNGAITKRNANTKLFAVSVPIDATLRKLGMSHEDYALIKRSKPVDRSAYRQTNFSKWKPVWWLLMKAGVVPETFYRKYVQK